MNSGRIERTMKPTFLVCGCTALAILGFATNASAALWQWGCLGTSADEQIVFNRGTLIVAPAKPSLGELKDLIRVDDLTTKSEDADAYNVDDDNAGFQKKMSFTSQDNSKVKLILTEKSSTRVSRHSHLICGHDEITDIYRKVYRYEPPKAPARNITLQCMEYQLTTTGGRPCISN
jgi:hypothetical protein